MVFVNSIGRLAGPRHTQARAFALWRSQRLTATTFLVKSPNVKNTFQGTTSCRAAHTWNSKHPHSQVTKADSEAAVTSTSTASTITTTSASGPRFGQTSSGFKTNNSSNNSAVVSGGLFHSTHQQYFQQQAAPLNIISIHEVLGNSRYQAYSHSRFSTVSTASKTMNNSNPSSADGKGDNSLAHQSHDATSGSESLSSSSSPRSDAGAQTNTNPSSSAPFTTTITATMTEDDKEDAWAVNESYTGHGGQRSSSSTNGQERSSTESVTSSPSQSSETSPSISQYMEPLSNPPPPTSSSSSSSEPSESEREALSRWQKTSESQNDNAPKTSNNNNNSNSSSNSSNSDTAGHLDLSSSTLVQQMLFGERPPHAEKNEENNHQHQEMDSEEETLKRQDSKQQQQAVAITAATVAATTAKSVGGSKPKPFSKGSKDLEEQEEEDHISKLDIRVGIVRSVGRHPDAESLYIEQVDVNDTETATTTTTTKQDGNDDDTREIITTRTIVSGLVKFVPQDYLLNRAVIVVKNMKAAKLRGIGSHGMLLCAMEKDPKTGETTNVALLEPVEGSVAGEKVMVEGYVDEDTVSAAVLNPKRKWFEKSRVHFSVRDGVAYYKNAAFKTSKGLVRCHSITKGEIS